METVTIADDDFLLQSAAKNDFVEVEVLASPRKQEFIARVINIYSSRMGVTTNMLGASIDFVGCPGSWGQEMLNVGERALVFLSVIPSGRLYEKGWRGHMVLEEIDNITHAIFQIRELWDNPKFPTVIRSAVFQDPKRSYASAVRFDVLDSYMRTLYASFG